jgi:hypothetical protein
MSWTIGDRFPVGQNFLLITISSRVLPTYLPIQWIQVTRDSLPFSKISEAWSCTSSCRGAELIMQIILPLKVKWNNVHVVVYRPLWDWLTDWLPNCCWPCQHFVSWFRVPRDSWPYFTYWRLWELSALLCIKEFLWETKNNSLIRRCRPLLYVYSSDLKKLPFSWKTL